jgi:hypothetical protein
VKWFLAAALFVALLAHHALTRKDADRIATDRELDALERQIESPKVVP